MGEPMKRLGVETELEKTDWIGYQYPSKAGYSQKSLIV